MSKQDDEYKALGKAFVNAYKSEYGDIKRTLRISFLKGMASGLGGVIGATLLVAVLIWALSFFGELPLVGRFADKVNDTVQKVEK